MKITEILTESQQVNEGPLGSAAGAVARGAGKVIGGVAKGVGALAGVPGGIKKAFQKGKQAATDVIGGKEEPAADAGSSAAAPAQQTAPAAGGGAPAAAEPAAEKPQGFVQNFKQGLKGKSAAPQTTAAINKQGPAGTAPATVGGGAQQQAVAKTAQAVGGDTQKANQTVYAQVKSQIDQLDKKGKQRILQLLQKSMQQAPAKAAPAQQPAAQPAPATGPGSQTAPAGPGAATRTEPDLNAPAGEQPAAAAGKKKPAPKKKVAPSQAEIDADRARIMGPTSDSVIRTGRVVAESFTLYRR